MAFFANRVMFRAASGGTGDFVDASAITGYRRAVGNLTTSQSYYYVAESDDKTEWEVGQGLWNDLATNELARGVQNSSTGGTVNFTTAPKVAITAAAEFFDEVYTFTRLASTTSRGTSEFATDAEAQAMSSTSVALTPSNLAALAASQSDQETGSSVTRFVTPGIQHQHQSAAKCWGEFTANSTTILRSYNITSIANTATGVMTVTIANDFSNANWACFVSRAEDDMTLAYSATYDAKTAGTVILRSVVEAGSGSHPTAGSGNASWSMMGMGDLP